MTPKGGTRSTETGCLAFFPPSPSSWRRGWRYAVPFASRPRQRDAWWPSGWGVRPSPEISEPPSPGGKAIPSSSCGTINCPPSSEMMIYSSSSAILETPGKRCPAIRRHCEGGINASPSAREESCSRLPQPVRLLTSRSRRVSLPGGPWGISWPLCSRSCQFPFQRSERG